MSQQESKEKMLNDVKILGEGALGMIKSLDKMVKGSFAQMGEKEALAFAKQLKDTKMDKKVEEFKKQIKDLSKTFK